MNFDFLREQYDGIIEDLFKSSFVVNATVFILDKPLASDDVYDTGQNLDGRFSTTLRTTLPLDLNSFYRVKVFPLEKNGLRLGENVTYQYGISGRHEPYDRWVSCLLSEVKVRQNNTIFDFAKYVQLENVRYTIKGVVTENFGTKSLVHIFLVKERHEGNS
jgi:hypothetical protein